MGKHEPFGLLAFVCFVIGLGILLGGYYRNKLYNDRVQKSTCKCTHNIIVLSNDHLYGTNVITPKSSSQKKDRLSDENVS